MNISSSTSRSSWCIQIMIKSLNCCLFNKIKHSWYFKFVILFFIWRFYPQYFHTLIFIKYLPDAWQVLNSLMLFYFCIIQYPFPMASIYWTVRFYLAVHWREWIYNNGTWVGIRSNSKFIFDFQDLYIFPSSC